MYGNRYYLCLSVPLKYVKIGLVITRTVHSIRTGRSFRGFTHIEQPKGYIFIIHIVVKNG